VGEIVNAEPREAVDLIGSGRAEAVDAAEYRRACESLTNEALRVTRSGNGYAERLLNAYGRYGL
jgi:hypothetical protein